jgi:hypothetical protein
MFFSFRRKFTIRPALCSILCFYCISIYTSSQANSGNFPSEQSLIKYIYIETFKGVKMFKAIKEFFFGKETTAPKVEDTKVEAVNAAPYKVEAPVAAEAKAPAKAKPTPAKKAAPKAKAPAKAPAKKSLAKAGDKKQPGKKPPAKKTK